MNTKEFFQQLDERVSKYDLLCHPFYKAWSAGRLTREDLREYAQDYYHHVEAFPSYLAALGMRLEEGELRNAVLANMLPMSEQRHEHMDLMVESLRKNVGTADLIFTDQATSFQLRHYLCNQKPVIIERSSSGLETFRCEGFHVIFTGPNDGALTAQALEERWLSSDGRVDQSPADHVWVLQGGWASGLGEELRRSSEFAHLEVHSFGRFLEVFELPQGAPCPPQG